MNDRIYLKFPGRFLIVELKIFIGLLLLQILSVFHKVLTLPFNKLTYLFNFKTELSLPTLYSTINLFIAFFLSFLISKFDLKFKQNWIVISFTFLFLTIDESCMIHENLSIFLNRHFDFLNLQWWMIYGVLTIIFLIYNITLLNSLKPTIRKVFFLSGILFLIGAFFLEFIKNTQEEFLIISALSTLEESLEMLSIVFFNYSMLKIITNFLIKHNITISIKE